MPVPDSITALVAAARRRLLLMATANRTILYVGLVAAASAGLLGLARHVVLPWAEWAALIGLGVAVLASLVVSVVLRPAFMSAAIETDNRLGSFDRLATAIELTGQAELDAAEVRQVDAASAWASNRTLAGFGALLARPKLAGLVAFAVALALVLALVPSQADAVLAQQREIEAILEEEAQRLEELAEEAPELLAETLEQTADDLRTAETLEEALSELGEARQELAEQRDPSDLARRTAVNGLERRLEQAAGISAESLSDALQQLAQNLDQLTQEQLEAVSEALQQGADDLAGIDQPLADALANAAEVPSGASLSAAASQAARAEGELTEGELRDLAEGEIRDAQQRITDAIEGQPGQSGQPGEGGQPGQGNQPGTDSGSDQGSDSGADQGSDSGSDSGADSGSDSGADSGSDSGADSGSDSGQGGSGGSGTITDVDNPGAGGSGTGSGQVGRGEDFDDPRPPRFTEIADQLAIDAAGEERVRLSGSETAEEVLGRDFGTGRANLPTISYAERAAEYQRQALDALDSISIPPSLQDIIRAYFTELQP